MSILEQRVETLEEMVAAQKAHLCQQTEQLDRIIGILDTMVRVRNFVAWMSPFFALGALLIGIRMG